MPHSLPELLKAANLIISMPPEYEVVVSNFLRVEEDKLVFKDLAEALIDEEKRRRLCKTSENLAQSSTYNKPLNRIERRAEIKCNNCGKRGHYSNNCRNTHLSKNYHQNDKNSYQRQYANNQHKYALAKFSEYREENANSEETNIYSHVAFAGTHFSKEKSSKVQSSKANYGEEYRQMLHSSFRGNNNKLKSFVVTVKNNKYAEQSISYIVEEEVIPPKRAKSSDAEVEDKFRTPDNLKKVPDTPGKDIEDMLIRIPLATSKFSFSNLCTKRIKSTENMLNTEELLINKELNELYFSSFNCKIIANQQNNSKTSGWILDSGASLHMSYDKTLFETLTIKSGGKIRIADGGFMEIMGFGSIKLMIKTSSEPIALFLSNVAYVLALHTNLMSVHCLTKYKFEISFEKDSAQIEIRNEFLHFSDFINNNYVVSEESRQRAMLCVDELHKRMAHRNIKDILRLKKHELEISKCSCSHQCNACMQSKSIDLSFPQVSEKPDKPLDIIVADVC